MCECGCTSSDERYTLPGPGKSFYLIRLSGHCLNCDAPSGVTIERHDPGTFDYADYQSPEYTDGPLPLEKWADCYGAAIVCGMRRHEFVKKTREHLIGVSSAEMGSDNRIDDIGAETLLEEMYADAQTRPYLVGGTD